MSTAALRARTTSRSPRAGAVVLRRPHGARSRAGASCVAGPSGSGKSTLLRLLDRLADPDAGTVRYRGRDVREYDPLALRREVCLVPQLPAPLEGTVADNVLYGVRLVGGDADVPRLLELSARPGLRGARRVAALRRRAAARDARARARARAGGAAARRADLGARRGGARRGRAHARSPARRARALLRARHARPRPGGAAGRLGAAARARRRRGRQRAHEHARASDRRDRRQPRPARGDARARRRRGRRLVLAARRPRGGHRRSRSCGRSSSSPRSAS